MMASLRLAITILRLVGATSLAATLRYHARRPGYRPMFAADQHQPAPTTGRTNPVPVEPRLPGATARKLGSATR